MFVWGFCFVLVLGFWFGFVWVLHWDVRKFWSELWFKVWFTSVYHLFRREADIQEKANKRVTVHPFLSCSEQLSSGSEYVFFTQPCKCPSSNSLLLEDCQSTLCYLNASFITSHLIQGAYQNIHSNHMEYSFREELWIIRIFLTLLNF